VNNVNACFDKFINEGNFQPPDIHGHRNHVGRVIQVSHGFWGVWDSHVFVPHGFCDEKIIFRLHFLE